MIISYWIIINYDSRLRDDVHYLLLLPVYEIIFILIYQNCIIKYSRVHSMQFASTIDHVQYRCTFIDNLNEKFIVSACFRIEFYVFGIISSVSLIHIVVAFCLVYLLSSSGTWCAHPGLRTPTRTAPWCPRPIGTQTLRPSNGPCLRGCRGC